MVHSQSLKEKAILLRKSGLSYSEILGKISVAKSTLSLWLRSVGLSKRQKQRLTIKKLAAMQRGGQRRHEMRLELIDKIYRETEKDIVKIGKRDLFLLGVALYWAEGSKEKDGRPGQGITFTNADPSMVRIFLIWLIQIGKVSRQDILFEIFIHENHRYRVAEVIDFWSNVTKFAKENFRVYYKKNKIKTKRTGAHHDYFGLTRTRVRASSTLNRRIAGWVRSIVKHCQVV